jgi:hypothetical protein
MTPAEAEPEAKKPAARARPKAVIRIDFMMDLPIEDAVALAGRLTDLHLRNIRQARRQFSNWWAMQEKTFKINTLKTS